MKRGQETNVISDSDEDQPLAASVEPSLKLPKNEWRAPEDGDRKANKQMSKTKWVKSYYKESLIKNCTFRCTLCVDAKKEYKDTRGNNTHGMEAHLKEKHQLSFQDYDQARLQVAKVDIQTSLMNAAAEQKRKTSLKESDDPAGAQQWAALAYGKAAALFVRHGVPHCITRDPDWKELFGLKAGFALPQSQRDLKNAILGEAAMITKANRQLFGTMPITVAVDGGKTNQLKTVAIAAYCNGQGKPLAIVEKKANESDSDNEDDATVRSPDSAKAQAHVIASALTEAKLQCPIVAIVSDNAANIVAACAQLVEEGVAKTHIRCIVHSLHLVLNATLLKCPTVVEAEEAARDHKAWDAPTATRWWSHYTSLNKVWKAV